MIKKKAVEISKKSTTAFFMGQTCLVLINELGYDVYYYKLIQSWIGTH